MKNIVVYYFAILLPIPLLIWLSLSGRFVWFSILLLIYALPYRTVIDGARLVDKHLMTWKQVWKLLIPGRRLKYTRELYFKN